MHKHCRISWERACCHGNLLDSCRGQATETNSPLVWDVPKKPARRMMAHDHSSTPTEFA